MIYILWHWYGPDGFPTRFELEEYKGPPELLGMHIRSSVNSAAIENNKSGTNVTLICQQIVSFQESK